MSLPSIAQLQALLAVARCGSFSGAGRDIGLSQSALSRQILALEDRVGSRLFDRLGRRAVPTAAGAFLIARSGPLVAELERTLGRLAAPGQGPDNRLRIGTSNSLAVQAMPAVLSNLSRRHRSLDLQLVCAADDELAGMVSDGQIDVAIVDQDQQGQGLRVDELWSEALHLVLPAGHPGRSRSITSYAGERFLLPDERHVVRRLLDARLLAERRRVQVVASYTDISVIKALVAAGLGLSLLPASTVRQETRSGQLAAWPLVDMPVQRQIVAISDPRRETSPALGDLLSLLRG